MLTNIVYAIGVILIILGIIGFLTDLGVGVGVGGLVLGIILVVVAKFVLSGRGSKV